MKRSSKKTAVGLLTLILIALNFAPATGQSFAVDKVKGIRERQEVPRRAKGLVTPGAVTEAPRPVPLMLPGSNSVLCAIKVWDNDWSKETADIDAGVYTIEAKPGGQIKPVHKNQSMMTTLSGVKIGTTYYAITFDGNGTYYYQQYSTSTWGSYSKQEIDDINGAIGLAYNPKDGKTYGIFPPENSWEGNTTIGIFSTYSAEHTDLYETERDCVAIACNKDGEMYAIMGYTGWLVRLYPSAAASPNGAGFEYIGKTGFAPTFATGFTNTLAFDDATGKLYWLYCGGNSSGLVELDTTTGAGTLIREFERQQTFTGAFAMPYKVPDDAPGRVSDIRVNFDAPASLGATLQAVAPARTANGSALSGTLTVGFKVNGSVVAEVEGVQPGATAVTPALTLPEGLLTVEAVAATATSEGEWTSVTSWGGEDVPGAVTGLTLGENADGAPVLSWTAPATGAHNGYFNPEGLTYTVVRYPDKTTTTGITYTGWTDAAPAGVSALWYEVTAVNAKGQSPATATEKKIFGAGFDVPWTEQFDSQADFDLWTVVDLNGSTTWQYSSRDGNIQYSYSTDVEREADDWIFSPRINLKAGVTYALTYDAASRYAGYKENFKWMLGRGTTPEAMTQLLVDRPDFDNTSGLSDRVVFTVPADGAYNLGLYCYSPAHNWTLSIDNVGVSEIVPRFPSPVADLTVKAAPQGALSADISFTVPSTRADGTTLNTVVTANLYRNGSASPVWSKSGISRGYKASWTDTGITEAGTYTYKVVLTNSDGDSSPAEASAFVGADLPGPVVDLALSEAADGSVTLTWKAPVTGANGGYFDPDGITYRVMRSHDGKQLADGLTTLSYTDANPGLSKQELCYYLVWPVQGGERGAGAWTPLNVVLGPAIAAPVTETFPAADYTLYPWVGESDGSVQLWSLEYAGINPPCDDQNGDRGLAMLICTEANRGITGTLTSPKISLKKLKAPELSFWMYHSPGTDGASEQLRVGVSTAHGAPVEKLVLDRDNGSTGWQRHALDLSQWSGEDYVQIAFIGKSLGLASIYIDNIAVAERTGTDAAVVSVTGPSRIGAGITAPYDVIVANNGSDDLAGVTVAATLGGTAVATPAAVDIAAGKSATVRLDVTAEQAAKGTLAVKVTAAGDANADNDTFSRQLTVVTPVHGVPSALTATASDGTVSLGWLAADASPAVTDDVESYTDFAINGIGDYLTYDADFDYTCYIAKDLETYPNMNAPKAFQVLNAKSLGIDIWDEGTPHSGNRMLAALASLNRDNDDWLISPLLSGREHVVSFWAKAFTREDGTRELMRVLWSDGSTSPADFTPLHDTECYDVPDMWTEYRFAVPEGARRFAINCVSRHEEGFALFVDDLGFNDLTVSPDAPSGYEVYRDGVSVATVTTPAAADVPGSDGTYTYKVRALWPDGTAGEFSEPVEVTVRTDGIVEASASEPRVTVAEGHVTVEGLTGERVSAALPDGRLLFGIPAAEGTVVRDLPAGPVLLTVGTRTRMILVP